MFHFGHNFVDYGFIFYGFMIVLYTYSIDLKVIYFVDGLLIEQ